MSAQVSGQPRSQHGGYDAAAQRSAQTLRLCPVAQTQHIVFHVLLLKESVLSMHSVPYLHKSVVLIFPL